MLMGLIHKTPSTGQPSVISSLPPVLLGVHVGGLQPLSCPSLPPLSPPSSASPVSLPPSLYLPSSPPFSSAPWIQHLITSTYYWLLC